MESSLSKTSEREESPISHDKYREIISTLPTRDGWSYPKRGHFYQGFWCNSVILERIMSTQEHFKAQPDNIFLCSHPKTGTTWLKALSFAIVTRTHFSDSKNSPLLTKMPHDCLPFMEIDLAQNVGNQDSKIPLVATHIPYNSLPKSIINSSCKIVYICREPKDAFVSLWHFYCKLRQKNQESDSLEEAIDLFCEGANDYGPYWEHVLGYWRASQECPRRILFLKYEDLKNETLFYVKTLAEFMGHPFTLEEESQGVVQRIIHLCGFENLSNLEVNKTEMHFQEFDLENKEFFRKGKIGDWENYLTPEMGARLDRITEQKLQGSGLTFVSHQMHDNKGCM